MRQISQGLREKFSKGEDVCKEYFAQKVEELIEVRCGRHGKAYLEVRDEFKQICEAALDFEDFSFRGKA